jgi:hypothetical protein
VFSCVLQHLSTLDKSPLPDDKLIKVAAGMTMGHSESIRLECQLQLKKPSLKGLGPFVRIVGHPPQCCCSSKLGVCLPLTQS